MVADAEALGAGSVFHRRRQGSPLRRGGLAVRRPWGPAARRPWGPAAPPVGAGRAACGRGRGEGRWGVGVGGGGRGVRVGEAGRFYMDGGVILVRPI
jgi:hypothetical protein